MPQPSTSRGPIAPTRRSRSSGRALEAECSTERSDATAPGSRPASSANAGISGPGRMAKSARRAAISATTRSVSHFGMSSVVPPTTRCGRTCAGTVAVNDSESPKTWTLPREYRQEIAFVRPRWVIERWVSSAPFGKPVVPLVYPMTSNASGSGSGGATAAPASRNRSNGSPGPSTSRHGAISGGRSSSSTRSATDPWYTRARAPESSRTNRASSAVNRMFTGTTTSPALAQAR